MNSSQLNLASSSPVLVALEVNTYELPGGATIIDKTNGIARVVFSEENTTPGQPAYKFFVNDKKVVSLTEFDYVWWNPKFPDDPCFDQVLVNSITMTLESQGDLIRVEEQDPEKTTVFYIDTAHTIKAIAYGSTLFKPCEISQDEALEKIKNFSSDFPDIAIREVGYNRHGVVAYGWNKTAHKNDLFWAAPDEANIRKIEDATGSTYRGCNPYYLFRSDDCKVLFMADKSGTYLNMEPVKCLKV